MILVVLSLLLFLGTPPYEYEASISVRGSPTFVDAMEGNLRLLAEDDTLAWWVAWASLYDVVIEERADFAEEEWGAWPFNSTIGVGSGAGASPREAAILVHEIQHLMDDTSSGNGITCSIEPWSHARVIDVEILAGTLLGTAQDYLDGLRIIQAGLQYQVDTLGRLGLTEPCGT